MNYIISAVTDVGTKREKNEDRAMVQEYYTAIGSVALAVICDGIGGLAQGEVASQMMIQAFEAWGQTQIPVLCAQPFEDYQLRHSWESLIDQCNKSIREYGFVHGVKLGTTVVALLVTPNRYYLLNIGDSRAYEITETNIMQLTEDQTLVNSEVKNGKITREQAVRTTG
jgi:serine/threonine protein phosphatase PrpC